MLALAAFAAALADVMVPVHGFVLMPEAHARAIVRVDGVPQMLAARSTTYRVRDSQPLKPGMQFDALLDRTSGTLFDARAAEPFVAGAYDPTVTHVLGEGDRLPDGTFVDQDARLVRLDDFRGKVLLVSFVFTRCGDANLCPAISGKFAYLQHALDPAHFHLVEFTIDPVYDSPAVLAQYARRFATDGSRWSLLTGETSAIKNVLDTYGIQSIQDSADDFVHNDRLFVVAPDGTIRDVVRTAGWNPDDVIAEARSAGDMSSSPLRRFELASVSGVLSLCGGSQTTGIIVLDSAVFLIGVLVLGAFLVWVGKKIWANE